MAKREKKPEPLDPPKDLGAALFLELMMQMLAFFILLTSMAVIVEEKRLAALGSLAGTFSALPKGANLAQGKGPALPTRDIVEGAQAPKRTAKALTEVARSLGLDGAMTILPLDKDKVRVRLPEWIVFAPGQVNLSPAASPLLDRMARIFRRPEVIEVRIEGHTDDTPVNSRLYPSNWELSAARAMSVFRALAKRGVPRGRMIAAGMGDQHPINGKPSLSRRVEIVLQFRPVTAKPEHGGKGGKLILTPHRPAVTPAGG
ncbi:MAG: flagellar motor protein MotB [Mariprofundaceae bacterium]